MTCSSSSQIRPQNFTHWDMHSPEKESVNKSGSINPEKIWLDFGLSFHFIIIPHSIISRNTRTKKSLALRARTMSVSCSGGILPLNRTSCQNKTFVSIKTGTSNKKQKKNSQQENSNSFLNRKLVGVRGCFRVDRVLFRRHVSKHASKEQTPISLSDIAICLSNGPPPPSFPLLPHPPGRPLPPTSSSSLLPPSLPSSSSAPHHPSPGPSPPIRECQVPLLEKNSTHSHLEPHPDDSYMLRAQPSTTGKSALSTHPDPL